MYVGGFTSTARVNSNRRTVVAKKKRPMREFPHRNSKFEMVKVDFHGDVIEAVHDDGKVMVSLNRCCDIFGIKSSSQHTKLKKLSWATLSIIDMQVSSDDQSRSYVMMDLGTFAQWLVTINSGKVRPELRGKLERYQREARDALERHFFGRRDHNPNPVLHDTPYTRRLRQSGSVELLIPTGYWSVFVESASFLIHAEQAFARAGLEMDADDLLDGSVGRRWADYRRGKLWAVDSLKYPHTYPDDMPSGRAGKAFPANCYHECELLEFRRWLRSEYSGTHFCSYLMSKYKKTPQKVTAALGHVRVMLAQKSNCRR
jgi:hypothetical protein